MRHYECECLVCGKKTQVAFKEEPYPEYEEQFYHDCAVCRAHTLHTRVLTKRTSAELHRRQAEAELRQTIIDKCNEHNFKCKFLYTSVVIATPIP